MFNVKWREWPRCPECKNEGCIENDESLLLVCTGSRRGCQVLGWQVNKTGKILKVWHKSQKLNSLPHPQAKISEKDLDLTCVEPTAKEIIESWDRAEAEYQRLKKTKSRNFEIQEMGQNE